MSTRPPSAALPDEYAPRAPEDLHYATLYERTADRRRIQALFRLKELLDAVPLEVSDPGVAGVKLAWWREEIDRLANAQPRHPLTTWLHGAEGPQSGSALAPYLGLLLERVQAPAPPPLDVLAPRLEHALEPLLSHYLSSKALDPSDASALCRPMATAQLSWELLRCGISVRSGCRLVPDTGTGPELAPATLAETLSAQLEAVPRGVRRRAGTPVTLARITRFNLSEAGSSDQLRYERPEPAPLVKLGIALRTRFRG